MRSRESCSQSNTKARNDRRSKLVRLPNVHPKGWGEEVWYHNEPDYCFKALKFKPGGRSSLHYHIKKHETWVVARGRFTIQLVQTANGNRCQKELRAGDFQSIPPGLPHRLTCTSRNGGLILEASTQHFEDDSYRLEPGDSQRGRQSKRFG